MPDVQQKFRALNVEPGGGSPAATGTFIREEMQRWGEVIRSNNIIGELARGSPSRQCRVLCSGRRIL
jgi:hypothetical protein